MSKTNGAWRNRIVGYGEEPPDQLLANPLNFRIHPKAQQEATTGSLDTLGWIDDVIVNRTTGHVIDGHLRITLALRVGAPTIPVKYVELTEAEEEQALLSLDPIAAMAATDKAKLDELIRGVQTDNAQVMEYIAELAEREGIQYGAPPPDDPGAQIDKAEELREKWGVELGQLWQLGEHRLICGDCTDRTVVERVMEGEKAGAVVTDPPYGINREGIENDDPEGLADLFDGCLSVMPIENAVIIAFQSPRLFPVWLDAIRKCGHKFERLLWWRENSNAKPWRGFRMQGEAISVSSIGSPVWNETRSDPDTFDDINSHRDGHPTQKPLTVIEPLIGHTTGIILDPFLGSGTTLIACERLKRKCRAVEISPAYCAVAIQRWVDMTGGEPVLLG